MHQLGLVSISFRNLAPEQILTITREAGLTCIEWGSDVHAPCHDIPNLKRIAHLQKEAGITCCSYGTYFKLGTDDVAQLPDYIHAAKLLGTNILRLWCGNQNYEDYAPEAWAHLIDQCKQAAAIAEAHDALLCMECHNNTATNCLAGALALMKAVDSPAFRMYWQPNQYRTPDVNKEYAATAAPYIRHVHVFNWDGPAHYPLAEAVALWKEYLTCLGGSRHLLLEFMPDNDPNSLPAEAEALRRIAL